MEQQLSKIRKTLNSSNEYLSKNRLLCVQDKNEVLLPFSEIKSGLENHAVIANGVTTERVYAALINLLSEKEKKRSSTDAMIGSSNYWMQCSYCKQHFFFNPMSLNHGICCTFCGHVPAVLVSFEPPHMQSEKENTKTHFDIFSDTEDKIRETADMWSGIFSGQTIYEAVDILRDRRITKRRMKDFVAAAILIVEHPNILETKRISVQTGFLQIFKCDLCKKTYGRKIDVRYCCRERKR